mmetsp:Transcript_25176/g.63344  ORF Transcript_25176/g.63344 Transcript_25176/m.63344 type:complete len:313 (+) Transcript_25176:1041-1979(+)
MWFEPVWLTTVVAAAAVAVPVAERETLPLPASDGALLELLLVPPRLAFSDGASPPAPELEDAEPDEALDGGPVEATPVEKAVPAAVPTMPLFATCPSVSGNAESGLWAAMVAGPPVPSPDVPLPALPSIFVGMPCLLVPLPLLPEEEAPAPLPVVWFSWLCEPSMCRASKDSPVEFPRSLFALPEPGRFAGAFFGMRDPGSIGLPPSTSPARFDVATACGSPRFACWLFMFCCWLLKACCWACCCCCACCWFWFGCAPTPPSRRASTVTTAIAACGLFSRCWRTSAATRSVSSCVTGTLSIAFRFGQWFISW